MTTTELVIVIGTADIVVHMGVTIVVGYWLNRMAKREVTNAATNVMVALMGGKKPETTDNRERVSA